MPVHKFKDLEEARRALWLDGQAPALARRIARLLAFSSSLVPSIAVRGVHKFRSIEHANRDREERTRARVDFLRAERESPH
jgi:hypothetical protein